MWMGYESALCDYSIAICKQWISLGYKDTMLDRFINLKKLCKNEAIPNWLGDEPFHSAHKSNLLRKNEQFYKKYNWNVPNDLPYIWPI
jgi:esterase/lipase superfamily enzyme